jgi:hypothetical protein
MTLYRRHVSRRAHQFFFEAIVLIPIYQSYGLSLEQPAAVALSSHLSIILEDEDLIAPSLKFRLRDASLNSLGGFIQFRHQFRPFYTSFSQIPRSNIPSNPHKLVGVPPRLGVDTSQRSPDSKSLQFLQKDPIPRLGPIISIGKSIVGEFFLLGEEARKLEV